MMEEFSETEMATIGADMSNWGPEERSYWALIAGMGMRPGEPATIVGERIVDGLRCIEIGGFMHAATRRVLPIPDYVLPYLPATVSGAIYGDKVRLRVLRRIRALIGQGKTLRSARYRAATKLAMADLPVTMRDTILGMVPDERARWRGTKAIQWRFFQGHAPDKVAEAIAVIGI